MCRNCFIIFNKDEVEYDESNKRVCPYCGAPEGMLAKFRVDGKIVKNNHFNKNVNDIVQHKEINDAKKILKMLEDSFDIDNKIVGVTNMLAEYAKIQVLESYSAAGVNKETVEFKIKELKTKLNYLEGIKDDCLVFKDRLKDYVVDLAKPTEYNLVGREINDMHNKIETLHNRIDRMSVSIVELEKKVNKQQRKRNKK